MVKLTLYQAFPKRKYTSSAMAAMGHRLRTKSTGSARNDSRVESREPCSRARVVIAARRMPSSRTNAVPAGDMIWDFLFFIGDLLPT